MQQKLDEVNLVLSMCGQLIDGIKQATPMQIESHKVYFLTLQVAHLLQGGQVTCECSQVLLLAYP